MATLGLPAWRWLTTEDELERTVLHSICKAAVRMQENAQRG